MYDSNIEGINTSRLMALFCFLQARLDILKIHSRKMNLTRGINLRKIAELMPGASGAEVKVRSQDHFQSFMRHFFRRSSAEISFYLCLSDRVSAQRQGCTPWERGESTLPKRILKWQWQRYWKHVFFSRFVLLVQIIFYSANLNIRTICFHGYRLIYNVLYFHRWCRKTVRKTCPSRNSGSKH